MPKLYFVDSGQTIGDITRDQLQFLIDQLEEEDTQDRDYHISRDTLQVFKDADGPAELIAMLERALGDAEDMDIAWKD